MNENPVSSEKGVLFFKMGQIGPIGPI